MVHECIIAISATALVLAFFALLLAVASISISARVTVSRDMASMRSDISLLAGNQTEAFGALTHLQRELDTVKRPRVVRVEDGIRPSSTLYNVSSFSSGSEGLLPTIPFPSSDYHSSTDSSRINSPPRLDRIDEQVEIHPISGRISV